MMPSAQLSFWFGHFPRLGSDTAAMDRTFWRVVDGNEFEDAAPVPQRERL